MPGAVESESSRRLRELADSVPDRSALETGEGGWTYAELDAEVDGLTAVLLDRFEDRRATVALRLVSPLALGAAAFALPRSGHTVVPIDPTFPPERARALLQDVDADVLLSDVDGDDVLGRPVLTPADWGGGRRHGRWRPPARPASIHYTSGSTGVPKGITVDDDDQLGPWLGSLDLPATTRAGALAAGSVPGSLSFYRAVVHLGATLVTYDVRTLGLAPMPDWLADHRITALGTVPTVVRFLVPAFAEGRTNHDITTVALYGESLTWDDVAGLRRVFPSVAVHNAYGTTESGSIAAHTVAAGDPLGEGLVPTGRPLEGVDLHVLDEQGRPCPDGVAGELVVDTPFGGTSYWRRPDLSRPVWTVRPDGRRRVLTGDRAVIHNGRLELLGRLDHVVKISAYRVELGEVETALRDVPGVGDAVATARPDDHGDLRLVAAVSPAPGAQVHAAPLRAALARRLPPAMVPTSVAVVTELARLGNGKVDRSAVPSAPSTAGGRAPEPGLEADLARLFSRVLDVPGVGADDDFFALGGDSMRAARLFTEIQRDLGIDQPPTLLLDAPTVAALAVTLGRPGGREVLVPVRVLGADPPLFAVHGGLGDLLFLRGLADHLDPATPVYGLLAPALDGLWPAEKSLSELAARYLREVRRVQPVGPYRLFGYSLGGLIAHEMCAQLEAEGQPVALLAIGDTPTDPEWTFAEAPRQRQVDVVRQARPAELPRAVGTLIGNQLRHRRTQWLERGSETRWQGHLEESRRGVPVPVDLRGDFVMRAYGELARAHRPTALRSTPTVLLRSAEHGPRDLGWSVWAPDLDVVELATDHDGLVRAGVSLTGAALRDRLRAGGAVS